MMLGGDDNHLKTSFLKDSGPLPRIKSGWIKESWIFRSFSQFPIGKGVQAEMDEGRQFFCLPVQLPAGRNNSGRLKEANLQGISWF